MTTAGGGGLQYGGRDARGDGRWVTLDRRRVDLPAGGSRIVGFRLRVPRGAEAGDHFAGIVVLNERDQRAAKRRASGGSLQLRVLPRLAVAVQTTLAGPSRRELTAGRGSIEITPSATSGALLVRNTGNRLIRATTGDLALLQGDRELARHDVDLDSFVPRTQVTLRVPFEGTPARGDYRLRGVLRPAGGRPVRVDEEFSFGETAARELEKEAGREAKGGGVSAALVAAIGAVLLLVIATLTALLRRERRRSAQA